MTNAPEKKYTYIYMIFFQFENLFSQMKYCMNWMTIFRFVYYILHSPNWKYFWSNCQKNWRSQRHFISFSILSCNFLFILVLQKFSPKDSLYQWIQFLCCLKWETWLDVRSLTVSIFTFLAGRANNYFVRVSFDIQF